ncbi:MAG: fatty acid hydroxylase, partial [uncultured Cytophagales bacterium]
EYAPIPVVLPGADPALPAHCRAGLPGVLRAVPQEIQRPAGAAALSPSRRLLPRDRVLVPDVRDLFAHRAGAGVAGVPVGIAALRQHRGLRPGLPGGELFRVAAHPRRLLLRHPPADAPPPAVQAVSPDAPPVHQPFAVGGLFVQPGRGRGGGGRHPGDSAAHPGAPLHAAGFHVVHDGVQRVRAPGLRDLPQVARQQPAGPLAQHVHQPQHAPPVFQGQLRALLPVLGRSFRHHPPAVCAEAGRPGGPAPSPANRKGRCREL